VPSFERAVREVSRMLGEAGIRHALVGALGANAYRTRPRTTEVIDFLVGDEAFEKHAGGFVTMRSRSSSSTGSTWTRSRSRRTCGRWKRA